MAAVMEPLRRRGEELAARQSALPALRSAGYGWYSGLEAEIARLRGQMHEQVHQAERARTTLTAPLSARLQAAGRGAPAGLERELDAIDDALVGCERQLEATLRPYLSAVDRCLARARGGEETLALFAEAGFRLPPGERPVLAARAAWLLEPDAPPGALLLSDRRLRFERRDDRVLRRNRPGLAVERTTDRTVLLDEPHDALQSARDASSGVVLKEPRLTLTWRSGALVGRALTLQLERPVAAELAALCEALRRGDLSGLR